MHISNQHTQNNENIQLRIDERKKEKPHNKNSLK